MASLQLLPNEVLLEVFLNIDSARDVLALALQCRRFHDLCDLKTRRKYRRIEIGPHYKGHDLDILLSILRKPYRGLYVRHLTFVFNLRYIGGSSRWMKCKPEKSLPPQILDKLKKAIKEAGFGRRKKMVLNMILEAEKANFGRLDNKQFFYRQAVAALIISLSPRLESMDLGYTGYSETFASFGPAKLREMLAQERGERPWPEDYLLHRLLSKTNAQGKEASFLRNLRSVRFLNSSGEPREYEQTNVYGFLNLVRRLPSLEAVRFDTIENPQEEETMPCPPRVANYKKIEILRSVVDSRTLCAVIESARELRHFAFQVGGRAFLEEYVREIDPDRVYKSLLLHRDTLEHLQLDFEDHIDRCEMFDAECRERKKQERRDMEEEGMEYYTEDEVRIIGEDGRETWTYWDEELEEERQNLDQRRGKAVASSSGPSLLKGFARLKYLAIGARLLFYYTRILEQDSTDDEAFSMADHLPPNLESLLIYDYERGLNSEPNIDERNDRYSRLGKFSLANGRINLDRHISKLLEEKKDKLPLLRSVKGVEEVIQGGKTREEYDGDYEDEDDDEDERVSSPLSPFSHYSLSDNEGLSEHSKSDGDGEEAISSGGDGEAKDE